MRPLSVASIPSENEVLLGTRTGKEASEFKKTLINLKKGETLKMRGPFGIFKFQDESSPVVLFASGVGITPIRAMLKSLSKSNSRPVHLVYVANGYHLFDDELLELTPKEFELLLYLIERQGRVMSREHMLNSVWNYEFAGDSRIVDVHVSHLRDKLEENPKQPTLIKTVRGLGYKLERPKD